MKHVVVRCPGCGAEPGAKVFEACEACGSQLRSWCRLHSGEIGWLDGVACVRCIEADLRPVPRPAARVPTDIAAPEPEAPLVAGAAPRAYVTADAATPADHGGALGQGIATFLTLVLTLLVTGGVGGLMGLSVGFAYVARGGGPIADSLLAFGRGGAIVGLIFGVVVYARSAADLSRHWPPRVRRPGPPSAPVVHPPTLEPSASSWPGGRSPREILRGPPASRDGYAMDEPPPARGGSAGALSLAMGGAVFGMLVGWLAGAVFGIEGAAGIFAAMLGLGGLMVGLIRVVAITRADQRRDDG
jgi:hypothetical protein